MYVNATHFDYDTFLKGIIEHSGLEDVSVTDEEIMGILQRFEVNYKHRVAEQDKLTPIQREICHRFLTACLCDLYCNEDGSGVDATKITENMDRQIALSLGSLEELLTSDVDPFDLNQLCSFLDWISESGKEVHKGDYCFEIEGMGYVSPSDFVNYLTTWLESYVRNSLSDLDKFIFDNINWNILPREILIGITILERPGKTVKYGNALITFPTILLEVFPDG